MVFLRTVSQSGRLRQTVERRKHKRVLRLLLIAMARVSKLKQVRLWRPMLLVFVIMVPVCVAHLMLVLSETRVDIMPAIVG